MKRILSISLSLLILTALLHISVAKHYCSEMPVASKVSLSGQLASCGMEETTESSPVDGTNLTSHCCEDVLHFYGTDSNYFPSVTVVPEFFQYNFQVYFVPAALPVASSDFVKTSYTSASPPGAFMSTDVDLSGICVFRI